MQKKKDYFFIREDLDNISFIYFVGFTIFLDLCFSTKLITNFVEKHKSKKTIYYENLKNSCDAFYTFYISVSYIYVLLLCSAKSS